MSNSVKWGLRYGVGCSDIVENGQAIKIEIMMILLLGGNYVWWCAVHIIDLGSSDS